MTAMSALLGAFFGASFVAISCAHASGQSLTAPTETQVVPEADLHLQLPAGWRVLAFTGLEQGAGFPYQQWYGAAALGYQFKPILRPHLENIDPDKEHYLVFGGGYQYLRTTESGKVTQENRLVIELMFNYRLPVNFLVHDRNRVELRWVNGSYSTTYRNQLGLEHDFLVHGFRFTPYGSAEIFYDGAKHSWNEELYTAGIQWPYKRVMMPDTYYQRVNCSTCNPPNWNVAGATLNFYFRNVK